MRRLIAICVAALAAAVMGFCLVSLRHGEPAETVNGSDLNWLRTEFHLDDRQFAAIQALHEDYSSVCARHCADIAAASARREELQRSGAPAADLTAAQRRVIELEAVCNDATRAHLHQVAAVMAREEGERFLRMVEPHLAQVPHDGDRAFRH